MNTKVTFPELVDAVASAANTSKRTSEIFLKELFGLVGETLIAGENVKIKHLGTFKIIQVESRKSVNVNTGEEIEIPSHNKVSFIPDKDLADSINLPFSGFETVILSDEIPDEELERLSSTEEIDISTGVSGDIDNDLIVEENLPDPATGSDNPMDCKSDAAMPEIIEDVEESTEKPFIAVATDDTGDSMNSEPETIDELTEPGEEVKPELNEPENRTAAYTGDTVDELQEEKSEHCRSFKKGFIWGFFTAMLASLGTFIVVAMVVGFPLSYYEPTEKEEKADTVMAESTTIKNTAVSETLANDTADNNYKPEPAVKRDTISRTRFLTTMAREYYGNYNFWVYIYEENRNIIDNPNKIKPGTVIVIPEAGKYGIDKDNPQSLQTAKQKAFEIFKRYE